MTFKVGAKVKIKNSCRVKEDFDRAYGEGPFRVLKIVGNQILLFEYGWWNEEWFCEVNYKEFTDEEYESFLV